MDSSLTPISLNFSNFSKVNQTTLFLRTPTEEKPPDLNGETQPKFICLNARGTRFQVTLSDLSILPPECRLHKLFDLIDKGQTGDLRDICHFHNPELTEFYFNRDPNILSLILDYRNTKKFHIHTNTMCVFKLIEELNYWNIDESQIETCCWIQIDKSRDSLTEELQVRKRLIESTVLKENFDYFLPNIRRKLWNIFENREEEKILSRLYFGLLFILISLSTIDLMLRTLPQFRDSYIFDITEIVCISWFTFEWILRFIISPSKLKFIIAPLNITDLISLVPFFIYLNYEKSEIIETIKNISRIFRTFSIFKLIKHSSTVQTLSKTLIYSYKEILVYFIYLGMGLLTFSSFVFYSEFQTGETKFTSIFATFW